MEPRNSEICRVEETTPAFTRFLGVGSVYAINPCSEQTARRALQGIGASPIQSFESERVRALPVGSVDVIEEVDDGAVEVEEISEEEA